MVSDDWSAWLRLTATSGIGPAYARRLLRTFGSPEAIFSASFSAIAAVVGQRLAESLLTPSQACTDLLDVTGSWLSADARRYFVPLGDPRYPSALLQTEDPPLVLYVQGQVTALQAPRMLAMSGAEIRPRKAWPMRTPLPGRWVKLGCVWCPAWPLASMERRMRVPCQAPG